jgi:HNH endonuclease
MFDKKAWTKANWARIIEQKRAWRARNKAQIKAAGAAYYAANPEKVHAANNKWRAANPERVKATSARWHAANQEQKRSKNRTWRITHAAQETATIARRRARKLAQTCSCCVPWTFKFIYAQARALKMHVDHIQPLAKGGLHCLRNLQLLEPVDNMRKGAR